MSPERLRRYSLEWYQHELNNFPQRLPGGYLRILTKRIGCYNLTQAQVLVRTSRHNLSKQQIEQERKRMQYSQMFFGQTWQQFFAVVDQVIIERGLTLKSFVRLNKRLMNAGTRHSTVDDLTDAQFELYHASYPIYLALKRKGYFQADLWR